MGLAVVGVDVGSIRRAGGFAWSSPDGSTCGQDDPSALGEWVVARLDAGDRVAIALECPLSVPVPPIDGEAWQALGRARAGEGNRSWSAGAGTGALATGLVQLTWICRYVADNVATPPVTTTQLDRFRSAEASLLIAEAMVTADGKPEPVDGAQDHADALAAARRLAEILDGHDTGVPEVSCAPSVALNLAATAAMHAGLPVDPVELSLDVLVAKVKLVRR
jgi:hypothetical protein